jgi:glucose-6-phosphate dehydrogenase assembly protein OpcA
VAAALTSVRAIEDELRSLRIDRKTGAALQRTSVLTHIAWVPEEWVAAAEDVLAGLAERHPSRTIVLVPEPDADDGLEAAAEVECYPVGDGRSVCVDTLRIRLRGRRSEAPASVVEPLLISDLPVFLRWRGMPPFAEQPFEQLVDVVDRLIVDSTEWPDLPGAYGRLAEYFDRVAVSDIAWARTSRWRPMLASLWPGIGEVKRVRVSGTAAQAHLLAGWLRSRLRREIELEHDPSDRLVGVEIDGEPAPFPPGDPPPPAELLSDELDRFSRDRIYEEAARSAAADAPR